MSYKQELTDTMTWLGQQRDVVFMGQGVRYPGHGMFPTLEGVPMSKRIELPVMENAQLGMSLGMALTGKVVISIFPRFDFLICAMDSLVNSLDKLEEFTHGQYHAKVIIRVGIGSTSPMHPGSQHCGDYTEALRMMLKRVNVIRINFPEQAPVAYQTAYNHSGSYLIVEDMNLYDRVV